MACLDTYSDDPIVRVRYVRQWVDSMGREGVETVRYGYARKSTTGLWASSDGGRMNMPSITTGK